MDISSLDWAIPSFQQARELKLINTRELFESIEHVIEASDYDKSIKVHSDAYLNNLSCYSSVEIFIIHEELINHAYNQNKQKCHDVLDALFLHLDTKKIKNNLDIKYFGNAFDQNIDHYFNNIMSSSHKESYEDKYRNQRLFITPPSLSDYENTVTICELTLNNIEENIPELYKEINGLIDNIVIIESNGVNAGSYLNALGTFIMRTFKPESEHWTRILEHIVHESAHNLLYHIWYQEPLITDDDGLYYTPFRLDHRPLSGVYHAMYVLARTIFAFDMLLQNSVIREVEIKSHYNEANNNTPFKDKFFQTVKVIESSRKMTSFGNKLLDDCIQLVDGCESNF
ncbi:hypothetical protein KDD30_24225 (plasmid) [Photobacterium sp. GJ3]|uniref:aKG-HExxH-type peptide beta-hydroxylase n=1 Tax=Photobacterium sp. GJ3 TaxID=2829502 RepID=UPI001B8B644E|nr:HEXXH motif-containing putative peptide modification protein [Photobacterium sp. GJ3]QUJ69822.1 hypothetical protein KDD30_24225 [Photobacterium sp. GJ3]